MSYKDYAIKEFKAAGWLNEDGKYVDPMQKAVCQNVLELLEIFKKQGHSGSSAPYVVGLFTDLSLFKPIAPLTGKDDEWSEPLTDDDTYQNKRCMAVFKKGKDGQAFWLNGKVFCDYEGGPTYTNKNSRVPITFPWIKPKSEVVILSKENK